MEYLFLLLKCSCGNIGGDFEILTGWQSFYRIIRSDGWSSLLRNKWGPLSSSGLPLGPPGHTAVVIPLCWFLVLACVRRFSDPVFLSHLTVTYICVHLFSMQQIRNVCNLSGTWDMLAKTSNQHKYVKTICLDQVEAALELIVRQSCHSYPVCRWDHIR